MPTDGSQVTVSVLLCHRIHMKPIFHRKETFKTMPLKLLEQNYKAMLTKPTTLKSKHKR